MALHRSVWGTLGEVLVREYRRLLAKNIMMDDVFFFKKTVMLVFESIMLLTNILFYLIDSLFNVK